MSVYIKDPEQSALACVIWLHGLGADASDMAGLAQELSPQTRPLRHVFVDAPVRPVTLNNGMAMRAWYDIHGLTLESRDDEPGIAASQTRILDLIEEQQLAGFSSEKIFLAGFSQGGAMALYTGIHSLKPLAGIIALSSYLPLSQKSKPSLDKNTPFFLAGGSRDPIVVPTWTQMSKNWLENQGFQNISWHQYPMEHSICLEEIRDLSQWLNHQIQRINP